MLTVVSYVGTDSIYNTDKTAIYFNMIHDSTAAINNIILIYELISS